MSYGMAAKRRAMQVRTCAIISIIGTSAAFAALFGFAYLHDYQQAHAWYQAAQVAVVTLGAVGAFVSFIALLIAWDR